MKNREGFVSNSSSASFIVKFKSDFSRDQLATFIRKSDEWLDKWWDVTEREAWDWSAGIDNRKKIIETIVPAGEQFLVEGDGYFTINPETTMMNDWRDIPLWQLIRALHEGRVPGSKLIENRQVFEEHSDCNILIDKVDTTCWEYDQAILHPGKNVKAGRISEAKLLQEEIEYEYLTFLSKINAPLTEEETLLLAKKHLTI